MNLTDKQILKLIDLLIYEKKITSIRNFCQDVKMLEQTISKIKKGKTHFTVKHIYIICNKYNVNANWIFSIESNVFNKESIKIKENKKENKN